MEKQDGVFLWTRGSHGQTHTLEDLLPTNIAQATIQILDSLHNILYLALVGALNGTRVANRHVEGELDAAIRLEGREPATRAGCRLWCEADTVFTRVGSSKGEAATGRALLVDDAVVVVKDFLGEYQQCF